MMRSRYALPQALGLVVALLFCNSSALLAQAPRRVVRPRVRTARPRPRKARPDPSAKTPVVKATVAVAAATTLTDEVLRNSALSLQLLALTEEVKSADWGKMKGFLTELEKTQVESVVWFARPDGSYYTVDKGLSDQNLKDRPYFPRVMAGKTVIGDLATSKSTGKDVVVVTAPVKKGDAVVGALGSSIYLDKLAERVATALRLPSNAHFWACDATGKKVALSRQSKEIFLDPTSLNSPTLTQAVSQMVAQPEGSISYDYQGETVKGVYETSSLTGWHFVFGVLTPSK